MENYDKKSKWQRLFSLLLTAAILLTLLNVGVFAAPSPKVSASYERSSGTIIVTLTPSSPATSVKYALNDGEETVYTEPIVLSAVAKIVAQGYQGSSKKGAALTINITKEETPTATFTAIGSDTGTLTDVNDKMKYSTDGTNWSAITGTSANLTGLSAGTVQVIKEGSDTTFDSDAQSISITKAVTPSLNATQPTTIGGKGSIPTTSAHQFSTDGTNWSDCTGTKSDLSAGTYYVRVKASETVLASDPQQITINAYQGTKETTPTATFTATGADTGTLTNVTNTMKYSTDGTNWTNITGTTATLTGLSAGTIQVVKKGNGTTTADSDAQSISITKAVTPSLTASQPTTIGGKGSIPTTSAHQFSTNGTTWSDCTGTKTNLSAGTYYVRVKATGTVLASAAQTITINAYSPSKETTPSATFTATGADTGTLTNVTNTMKYSTDGTNWTNITGTSATLTGLSAGTIQVVKKGNGTTTVDSDAQSISITKASAPTGLTTAGCTDAGNTNGKLKGLGTTMEYKLSTAAAWTAVTAAADITAAAGTYYVRTKAANTVLASSYVTLTVSETPTYTITCATATGGTVTADASSSIAGQTVTVTVTPAQGYSYCAPTASVNTVTLAEVAGQNGKYSFTMPAQNVTISASFIQLSGSNTYYADEYYTAKYSQDSSNGNVKVVGVWKNTVSSVTTVYVAFSFVNSTKTVGEVSIGGVTGTVDQLLPGFSVVSKDDNSKILCSKTAGNYFVVHAVTDISKKMTVSANLGSGGWNINGTNNVTLTDLKLKATDFVFTAPNPNTYTGNAVEPTVAAKSGVTGVGTITKKYSTDSGLTWSTTAPVNVGSYRVAIDVAEGTDYAAINGLTDTSWVYSITKATPTVDTKPTAGTVTYGASLASSTLVGGVAKNGSKNVAGTFSWVDSTTVPTVTNSGYSVLFTPTDTNNYNTTTCTVNITVNKAAYSGYTDTASVTLWGKTGEQAQVTLPSIPGGASYGTITNPNTSFFTVGSISGGKVTVTSAKNWDADTENTAKTFTVAVTADGNHQDYTITVTVNPAFAAGVNETIKGKADGKLVGVTSDMEYKKSTAANYTAIAGNEVTGLTWGDYHVRFAAKGGQAASEAKTVTIGYDRALSVSFDSMGGSSVAAMNNLAWHAAISKPADPTRAKSTFNGWYLNGEKFDFDSYQIGSDIKLIAHWILDETETGEETRIPNEYDQGGTTTTIQVTGDGGIQAGGLEEIAVAAKEANPTENVKVVLSVRHMEESDVDATQLAAIKETVKSGDSLLLLEITLKKTVGTTQSSITDTGSSVIEIVIPYDHSNKTPTGVYRYHDDRVDTFTPDKTKSGAVDTYYYENGAIHLFSSKFSTYAISFSEYKAEVNAYYAIRVLDTKNGTVTASQYAAAMADPILLTVKAADGYRLEKLTVKDSKGRNVPYAVRTAGTLYIFTMPASHVTVSAVFAAEKPSAGFVDVFTGDYYYDAVYWAAINGITAGVDAAHFAPGAACTRAQMVTFLWRAAGMPIVNYAMSFTDVPANAYYAEAVRWALSKGITTGTSATTFSPDDYVTRAQTVTFLARMNGVADDAAGYTHSFRDVKADAYYSNAVAWAASKGITTGTSAATFGPDEKCTRGQIVTFLYRSIVR